MRVKGLKSNSLPDICQWNLMAKIHGVQRYVKLVEFIYLPLHEIECLRVCTRIQVANICRLQVDRKLIQILPACVRFYKGWCGEVPM